MEIQKILPKKIRARLRNKIIGSLNYELLKMNPLFYSMVPQARAKSRYISRRPESVEKKDEFGLPLPPSDIAFGNDVDWYWSSGRENVANMITVFEKLGKTFAKGDRIMDWGCHSGRMLRHLAPFSKECEIWGTDINAAAVAWCKQFLSPPFHFFTSTVYPHLPFEDGYFNYIYAGSVFTHIDDLADAWFLELRRVLKPGGCLYATIHDKHSIELLEIQPQNIEIVQSLRRIEEYSSYKDRDFGMFSLGCSFDSQVFYDREYLCEKLSPLFHVRSATEEAYGYQTALVLEKRAG